MRRMTRHWAGEEPAQRGCLARLAAVSYLLARTDPDGLIAAVVVSAVAPLALGDLHPVRLAFLVPATLVCNMAVGLALLARQVIGTPQDMEEAESTQRVRDQMLFALGVTFGSWWLAKTLGIAWALGISGGATVIMLARVARGSPNDVGLLARKLREGLALRRAENNECYEARRADALHVLATHAPLAGSSTSATCRRWFSSRAPPVIHRMCGHPRAWVMAVALAASTHPRRLLLAMAGTTVLTSVPQLMVFGKRAGPIGVLVGIAVAPWVFASWGSWRLTDVFPRAAFRLARRPMLGCDWVAMIFLYSAAAGIALSLLACRDLPAAMPLMIGGALMVVAGLLFDWHWSEMGDMCEPDERQGSRHNVNH